jgi:HlyD family secretion protein
MKRARVIPFVLLLVGLALWWNQRAPGPRSQLTYSGVVEATTVECAFEMAGTVEEVLVREGQEVKKGQTLARLDRRSLQATLAQMEARQGAAKARYEQLRNGYRNSDIAQAQARWLAAQADLEQMENGATSAQIQAARAQMESARERAEMTQEGYRREEVESARSQWEGARTNLQVTQRDYQRFQKLHQEGAISDQQLEARQNALAQARTSYQVASENYRRLRGGPRPQERQGAWQEYRSAAAHYQDLAQGNRPEWIAKAQAQLQERSQHLQQMREGPRKEEIEAAKYQWEEAQASLQAARVQWKKAELLCPMDGRVSLRNLEPGEAVTPGASVITLSDLHHPWVSLYVPEYERPRVRLGQVGQIRSEGLAQPVTGTLARIYEKAEFTPKFIQTPQERVNLVYHAKLAFDNQALVLHPGQPVDVELQP